MATFTMYLWEVMELEHDNGNGMRIGLDAYPIFDPSHREVLNRKIINRYMNREIGMETISMFKLALVRKMDEIMPMYNELYLTKLIEFDPLATFNLRTIREDQARESTTRNSTGSATNTSTTKAKSAATTTPQNELPDDWTEDPDYASSGASSKSDSENTSGTTGSDTGTGTTDTNGNTTVTGFQGSAADLLGKYRAQIINIDTMILGNISDLFMGIWDNGEEMLPQSRFGILY